MHRWLPSTVSVPKQPRLLPRRPRRPLRRAVAIAAVVALTASGLAATGGGIPAAAEPAPNTGALAGSPPGPEGHDIGPQLRKQRKVSMTAAERKQFAAEAPASQSRMRTNSRAAETGTGGVPVGGEKTWLVLDNTTGSVGAAAFELKALGEHIEVWVQKDLNYPEGDCRNDGVRNVVTTEQAEYFAEEFDTTMLPVESEYFSTAPARDGSQQSDVGFGAPLWELLGAGDPEYYVGDGDTTIALISNVRDANYYEPNSPAGSTYVAGFFYPLFNEAFDRNVMTIDSYDWLHRTGANPPDEEPGGLCSPKQAARPHSYEGTFAHEYQHLLEYYQDPGESTWLNEGLADYAQTLTGYTDTTLGYGETGADGHITCFQGYAGTDSFPYCGAENALTRWGDQGAESTLADYGIAYAFVTYVENQFGRDAVSYLHRSPKQGLESLQAYLDDHAPGLKSTDVIHDFLAQMALDRALDEGAKGLRKHQRDKERRFTADQLNSAIDWSWTGSYDSPGAPVNGADFVLGIADRPVNADTIESISFDGAETYEPDPMQWVIEDQALYAGTGNDLDRTAVYEASVPQDDAELTLSTKYNIESDWDFGVVQVSDDGGETYQTVSGTNTTSEHAEAADPRIVAELPGLAGVSDGYVTETYDLSAYAGQDVLISFRYLTDAAVNGNNDDPSGWWIRTATIGDTVITDGSSVEGARSATEVHPVPVDGWTVQAVGWSLDGTWVRYTDFEMDQQYRFDADRKEARKLFRKADRIGFLVTADDPDEVATKNAGYELLVNGVAQPGGGGDTASTTGGPSAAKKLPTSTRKTSMAAHPRS